MAGFSMFSNPLRLARQGKNRIEVLPQSPSCISDGMITPEIIAFTAQMARAEPIVPWATVL